MGVKNSLKLTTGDVVLWKINMTSRGSTIRKQFDAKVYKEFRSAPHFYQKRHFVAFSEGCESITVSAVCVKHSIKHITGTVVLRKINKPSKGSTIWKKNDAEVSNEFRSAPHFYQKRHFVSFLEGCESITVSDVGVKHSLMHIIGTVVLRKINKTSRVSTIWKIFDAKVSKELRAAPHFYQKGHFWIFRGRWILIYSEQCDVKHFHAHNCHYTYWQMYCALK